MEKTQLKHFSVGLILLAGIAGTSFGQKEIRLNAYSSYVFADNHISTVYNSYNAYYEGSMSGGYQWGGGLEMLVAPTKGIELKYLRQDAVAHMDYYNGISTNPSANNLDMAINYILLGGTNYFKGVGEKVEPFGGFGIGMAVISVKNPEASSVTITDPTKEKFAWNIKLGTNVWVNEKVGLKLQAELVSAVQSFGGGIYVGTGGGGAGVTGVSTMYQFSLGGALVFKLGK